jgi:hypothetical protein
LRQGSFRTIRVLALAATAGLAAWSCATAPAPVPAVPAGSVFTLHGQARFAGHALAGAVVTATRAASPGAVPGPAPQTLSGADGSFSLLLSPGSWNLGGHAPGPAGAGLVSVWGGNPLDLFGPPGEEVTLAFFPDPGLPAPRKDPGIGGRVLLDGAPVEGVAVMVYLAGSPLKGPPFMSAPPTAADGLFDLPLDPGTYEIVARKRAGGGLGGPGMMGGSAGTVFPGGGPSGAEGPMHKGDLAGAYPHNPVTLREGGGLTLDIPVTGIKKPREGGTLASGQAILLSGIIRGPGGNPAPGARALLYPGAAMSGRPAAISGPADAEGRFKLEAAKEGTFYLAARERIGAPPMSGELMGTYDASDDHSLALKWGMRVEGIELTMEPVP